MMHPTFMIIPSLSCQAGCKYCFGPHTGPQMDLTTAKETVRFIYSITKELGMSDISVIFHGGEPLLASKAVWETLLEGLSNSPGSIPVSMNVQSNLWNLDEGFLEMFRKYGVTVGTSLDGPEAICDVNRGEGYYQRTMPSLRKAEAAGLQPGAIVTLTRQTLPHAQKILEFFRDQRINPVLHAAVRGIGTKAEEDTFSLNADEYAEAVIRLFPWYVRNRKHFSVSTLDHYCSAVVRGEPKVCTMRDCLGMFLAIAPNGDITSCQRMAGMEEYKLGNIFDRPAAADLMAGPVWKRQEARQTEVSGRCRDCAWIEVCRGGCFYNAVSMGDGVIDPLCAAYKKIYDFLQERVLAEMVQEENAEAIRRRPPRKDEHPVLRSGPYISLACKPHPSVTAENARRILAAHALGKYADPDKAARAMVDAHYSADVNGTRAALEVMARQLKQEQKHLNNCYIHTTFRCNLRCTHCYASAGESADEMPSEAIRQVGEAALDLRFRQLVITGGEPLFHRDRKSLIDICQSLRGRGSNLVLRTNLTGDFDEDALTSVAAAFDQVVVSIDGNEETHDARRGKGTYANAVKNCERYAAIARGMPDAGELSLACVMSAADINGVPGQNVRTLGDRLEVKRVRFRPLLPLGRAARADVLPFCECINQHEPIEDILRTPFTPLLSCGIGQNIYICPDGRAYPCYAWQTEHSYLGNVLEEGLDSVMAGPRFTRLAGCTVETIEKCRECELRYLCGGACRAWGNREETDPNTAPPECGHLKKRVRALISAAAEYVLC